MAPSIPVQEALRAGDVAAAIAEAKIGIRAAPTDPDLRFLLFQLLCLAGDWTAAANQIAAQRKLLAAESPFTALMEGLLQAEMVREQVFRGEAPPKFLGEPPEWVVPLVRSLSMTASGSAAEAAALRAQAIDAAPAASGALNGVAFDWLMDGDSRIGPMLEVILQGTYYWIPQQRIRRIVLHPPEQPRDLVWIVAEMSLETKAAVSVFLPARYPLAATWGSDTLRLGRATEWDTPVDGFYLGRGLKTWMTESAEHSALEVRTLEFAAADEESASDPVIA